MKKINFLLCVLVFCAVTVINAQKEIHVSFLNGNNTYSGSKSSPLKTIQAAADIANPGDVVIVHSGIYRERVSPTKGGTSENNRISYQAAKNERVEIKGSEVIKNWKKVDGHTWKVEIPNSFFGDFNPYKETIYGDWLERGKWCHLGEVYLNNNALVETNDLTRMFSTGKDSAYWYCKVDDKNTFIWANFPDKNPNEELVEINVRQTVFYPSKPFVHYITVNGFSMSQAATPWCPPTAEQIGIIGTHWSKGWIIENNTICHSKCVGITLGKYGDEWDNKSESVEGYVNTIKHAGINKWNKANVGSHWVRNNDIKLCGQAGIAGSLGAIFSKITNNEIHDIGEQNLFWGYELAGIKIHAALDVEISKNHIYKTQGGIWLDWMAQGARISENLLHDNTIQDLSFEVNHGPIVIDNNLFLSPVLAQVKLSQALAFVHNLIAWNIYPVGLTDDRETPFLKSHSTEIAGYQNNPCSDTRFFNNILINTSDLSPYDGSKLDIRMNGNVFLMNAKPSIHEKKPLGQSGFNPEIKLTDEADGWYIEITEDKCWLKGEQLPIINSELLGAPIISLQKFEQPDGSSLIFNRDYTGKKRKLHPFPGPFEIERTGRQHIKVWGK